MLEILEFLDGNTNSANLNICNNSNLVWIIQVARIVIRIIAIAAPFALIIFGSLDFFKAIIAGDEKEMKAKRKPFIGRLIAAIILLLMPAIVNIIMKTIASSTNSEFGNCWTRASNNGSWEITLPTGGNSDIWQK